ncbi:MAG: 8-amino-7-oxononanoate synthase [Acidobacteriota bacterium]
MAVNTSLEQRVAARGRALADAGLRRALLPPHGIDLCSNDYLALAGHPALAARLIEAVRRGGVGSTGSRLLRGEREAFSGLEHRFAAFKRTARSLYFSSGYLANIAVLTVFPEAGDVILSDERNHASLIDGIRLSAARRVVFPHSDVEALGRLLDQHRGDGQAFVVVESLYSMDGDIAPLSGYATLCRAMGAALIVDEAHAVGVFGADGSGLIEASGIDRDVFVSVNTAGKALGVSGAFVAGPAWAIDHLVQRARPFIFSTAAPPAVAGALEASLEIVSGEPERRATLLRLSARLRTRLIEAGLSVPPGTSQIIPVLLGANERAIQVATAMQTQGFDVRAIRPPSVPAGTARLRLTVNVGLADEIIDSFATALGLAAHAEISG